MLLGLIYAFTFMVKRGCVLACYQAAEPLVLADTVKREGKTGLTREA